MLTRSRVFAWLAAVEEEVKDWKRDTTRYHEIQRATTDCTAVAVLASRPWDQYRGGGGVWDNSRGERRGLARRTRRRYLEMEQLYVTAPLGTSLLSAHPPSCLARPCRPLPAAAHPVPLRLVQRRAKRRRPGLNWSHNIRGAHSVESSQHEAAYSAARASDHTRHGGGSASAGGR